MDNLSTLIAGVKPNGVLTLDPPRKEFQGPLVIRQPMTIRGQGSTIWAERGPVIVIESTGVILQDLNIEVTGNEEKLTGEQTCAIIARSGSTLKLDKVGVRGDVEGVSGENRGWRYPRILRLNKIKAGQEHQFRLRLMVPMPCKIESGIAGVTVSPRDLKPGPVEVTLKIEKLNEGIRLRGILNLITSSLNRRIELSAHLAADGPGVESGRGQVFYEPTDWAAAASPTPAPPAPPPPPPPVPPVVPVPLPVKPKAPPPTVPPPAPTPAPVPQPTVTPTRSASKMRFVKPDSVPSVFGSSAPKEVSEEPVEEPSSAPLSPLWSPPPEATKAPPASSGSTPIEEAPPPKSKKPGMRKTDGLSGLFGSE